MKRKPIYAIKFDPRFEDTVCMIEATSYEQHTLWEKLNHSLQWQQESGISILIGSVDNRPINVSFLFVKLNGQRVCFYDGISQLVDHEMMDNWIDKHCAFEPIDMDRARIGADKFYLCVSAIANINKRAALLASRAAV